MRLLTLNVGSSNVKAGVFDGGHRLGGQTVPAADPAALASLVAAAQPQAIGHRLVHGGPRRFAPTRLTPEVLAELDDLSEFAPLHLPPAVACVRAVARLLPGVPQAACFDTAFHATLPAVERRFGLPRRFFDEGVRRYGFHGLSYESIAARLPGVSPRAAAGRTVVCHLGAGASLCGMTGGRSMTTTMGFSPLDGLLMATRCGRLDPGVPLYLMRRHGLGVEDVARLLGRESGLLGVSGVSADMRVLLADPSAEAGEAVELFCHTVAKEIAAAAVAVGGLDAIVFTAGIGERSPQVRRRVCDGLAWLGVELDPSANLEGRPALHTPASRVEVFCLPTDEEAVIARHTAEVLSNSPHEDRPCRP
jgi:acetate kinase